MRIAAVVLKSARVLGAGVALAAWGSDAHAAGRADGCESRVTAVRASLSAERQAQLQGAGDQDAPYLDFEPMRRTTSLSPVMSAHEGEPIYWQILNQ